MAGNCRITHSIKALYILNELIYLHSKLLFYYIVLKIVLFFKNNNNTGALLHLIHSFITIQEAGVKLSSSFQNKQTFW